MRKGPKPYTLLVGGCLGGIFRTLEEAKEKALEINLTRMTSGGVERAGEVVIYYETLTAPQTIAYKASASSYRAIFLSNTGQKEQ